MVNNALSERRGKRKNMTGTEVNGSNVKTLITRAQTLRASVVERVSGVAESGKLRIADRRSAPKRDQLLRDLGALHLAAAGGVDLDEPEADRLIGEITMIDAGPADEDDDNA
ncbi:MAG: hypothetical protein ACI9C1_003116 [Candidatus Aldehydirespiratoraceae bacterium]|jgi:hypothetical protein